MKAGMIRNDGIIWIYSNFRAVILRHESEFPLREANLSFFLPPVSPSHI